MKAKITSVEFQKEYESKFGPMFLFKIGYDGKTAFYSSKSKDQTKFVKGQESEFTETETEKNGRKYTNIKAVAAFGNSGYGRAIKKEQSRYSGFAVSYAKDLVIAGKIPFEELMDYAGVLFNCMVELDKSIES